MLSKKWLISETTEVLFQLKKCKKKKERKEKGKERKEKEISHQI